MLNDLQQGHFFKLAMKAFSRVFQSFPVVVIHIENRLISPHCPKRDWNGLEYIKKTLCSSKSILRDEKKKARNSVLLDFSLIAGGSVFKTHASFKLATLMAYVLPLN